MLPTVETFMPSLIPRRILPGFKIIPQIRSSHGAGKYATEQTNSTLSSIRRIRRSVGLPTFCGPVPRQIQVPQPEMPFSMGTKQLTDHPAAPELRPAWLSGMPGEDRKSTRLNSSHVAISYAVFCLQQ